MDRSSKKLLVAYSCLVLAFLIVRIAFLREPWNSDDLIYYEKAEQLAEGKQVIYTGRYPDEVTHVDFRLGFLVPLAGLIRIFGYNALTYYFIPLVSSLVNFLLIFKIAGELLPRSAVVPVAVLHLVYPFELRCSAVLLTDPPAAVLTLVYLYYIYKRPVDEPYPRKRLLWYSFIASLIVFFMYMVRENQPVVLLPAVAVLLFYRRYRWTVIGSMVLFTGWLVLEQLWYMSKGAPWGLRWALVVAGQHDYIQYLPRYTLSQYLLRSFRFIAIDVGWFGLVFFVCAIVAHVYAFVTSKNALVRACIAAGFSTYFLFTFNVYDTTGGRIAAMYVHHRFFQLFYYSSIIALAASLARITEVVRASWPNFRYFRVAVGAPFLLTLGGFVHATYAYPGYLLSARSDLWATFAALDAELGAEPGAAVTLTGTSKSLRVVRMFSATLGGHALSYREVSHEALMDGLASGTADWFFTDKTREKLDLSYLKGEDHERREHLLQQIENQAEQGYRLLYRGRSLTLFRRSSALR